MGTCPSQQLIPSGGARPVPAHLERKTTHTNRRWTEEPKQGAEDEALMKSSKSSGPHAKCDILLQLPFPGGRDKICTQSSAHLLSMSAHSAPRHTATNMAVPSALVSCG